MKYRLIFLITVLIYLINGCGLIRQVKEGKTFTECDYKLKNVNNVTIAGIRFDNIKSYSAIKFSDIGKLTYAYSQNALLLKFILNLQMKNPNPTTAALNKLTWILFIDDIEVASGNSNKRIEIPPNDGEAILPINIETNLKNVLSGKSLKTALNFGLNLVGVGGKPTRFLLKVKPTIMVGKKSITYPGYISVRDEYGSKD